MKRDKLKATKIIFTFFILLSLLYFIVGIISLPIILNRKNTCTEKVIATCTRVVKKNGTRHNRHYNNPTYRHYFEYEYNGKKYEIKYGIGFKDKNKFEVGKEYTIYVNPKLPSQFIIEGRENDIDTFALAAPIIGGSLTVLYSTIYFIFIKVYKKKEA